MLMPIRKIQHDAHRQTTFLEASFMCEDDETGDAWPFDAKLTDDPDGDLDPEEIQASFDELLDASPITLEDIESIDLFSRNPQAARSQDVSNVKRQIPPRS